MDNPIKFGTDGWRAVIAGDFTFDNVRVCAQGVASYLQQTGLSGRGLIVGYDTRFASEDFAAAVAEVVAGNGIKVYLCPRATPTPVISYGVLTEKAGGAVIITASHNPAIWNGFKYKDEHGSSAPDEVTAQIEKFIGQIQAGGQVNRVPLAEALAQGLVEYLSLTPVYLKQVDRLVNISGLRAAGFKIVIDSMYGAGAGYLRTILEGGNTEVIEINGDRNPLFPGIQPEPIAANLARLSEAVKQQGAHVGLATDGDADRMGVIDENGNFLTQLQVFALLSLYLLEVRGERGPLVKTITSTSMLDRLGEIFDVPVFETSVGFKYVAPIMRAENALIGGEESGGYGFRGHVAERDGVLACLYFLDLMAKTGKTPSELIDYLYGKVGPHYYQRADIHFPAAERAVITDRLQHRRQKSLGGVEVVNVETADGFRFTLADGTWLLIRFSGTEPVLRVYTESDS
ncbi:MAG: phosphoglucomutase/phosphomannomutase family protein, partial [Chloroflexi bacterium]|nr:phosphoglucomutase/phosphomannomutase family protein [Chloroflexota bacterium]